MRTLSMAFRFWVMAIAVTGIGNSQSTAVAAPATSIEGSWHGPFLGYTFTFEFNKVGDSWTGRLKSDKSRTWDDLQGVTFKDNTVRFEVVSEPPSAYTLRMDSAGKTLIGAAQIGQHRPLPLTLTRIS